MLNIVNIKLKLHIGECSLNFITTSTRYNLDLLNRSRYSTNIIAACANYANLDECISDFYDQIVIELTGDFYQNCDDFQQIKRQLSKLVIENDLPS